MRSSRLAKPQRLPLRADSRWWYSELPWRHSPVILLEEQTPLLNEKFEDTSILPYSAQPVKRERESSAKSGDGIQHQTD